MYTKEVIVNFKTAFIYLCKGYRIRIKSWRRGSFWELNERDEIVGNNVDSVSIYTLNRVHMEYILMDNWEVIPKYKGQVI